MIQRLRDRFVDSLAADGGVVAAVKWFVLGVILQVLFLIPLLPLVGVSLLLPENLQPAIGSALFFAGFLALRVFLFAQPCAEAGAIKRRGNRSLWMVCGVIFGPFALAAVAALETRGAKA